MKNENMTIREKLSREYIPLLERFLEQKIDLERFEKLFYKTYDEDPFLEQADLTENLNDLEQTLTNVFMDLECMDFDPNEHSDAYVSEQELRVRCTKNLAKLVALVEQM
ncbi:MAG: colicin immunity domain-containing protein [Vampirovibrionales bacterium]|nr:colicin immunity domain-containing protein [Vampirovibrionales bacterium]